MDVLYFVLRLLALVSLLAAAYLVGRSDGRRLSVDELRTILEISDQERLDLLTVGGATQVTIDQCEPGRPKLVLLDTTIDRIHKGSGLHRTFRYTVAANTIEVGVTFRW